MQSASSTGAAAGSKRVFVAESGATHVKPSEPSLLADAKAAAAAPGPSADAAAAAAPDSSRMDSEAVLPELERIAPITSADRAAVPDSGSLANLGGASVFTLSSGAPDASGPTPGVAPAA